MNWIKLVCIIKEFNIYKYCVESLLIIFMLHGMGIKIPHILEVANLCLFLSSLLFLTIELINSISKMLLNKDLMDLIKLIIK